MESLNMKIDNKLSKALDDNFNESMKNVEFSNLVKNLKISKEVGRKYTSKLNDTVEELKMCKNCKGLYMCKHNVSGNVSFPEKNENKLDFIYMPCKFQKELVKDMLDKNKNINDIKNARMKNIDIKDKNRVEIIKWLKNFYDNYEKVNTLKGLFLHGNFGSGKTYLIAALLNELEEKKNAYIEIVYFPELLRSIKDDFSISADKLSYLQSVDILLLDDIGAENVTAWGRDEILGTILQSRMNNKLTTFFTSNLNIVELEKHLSISKGSEDVVKARRIIERIKQLSDDLELVSVNRRK
ncbi:MAG: AFG1/ZapE family ATPase [Bacilli bacterium]